MEKKVTDIYQSWKSYKNKPLELHEEMEKTWKCGEPSQEWPALKWLQDATDNIQDVTKEPRATSKELWA